MKILRVDADERKIGLSRKRVEWAEDELGEEEAAAETPTAAASVRELKGGVGSGCGPAVQAGFIRTRRAEETADAGASRRANAKAAEGRGRSVGRT